MIKLENIHKAMNDPHVQMIAKDLHFDFLLVGLDGAEQDPTRLRKLIVANFAMHARLGLVVHEPSEEQLLATERILQTKIETGQPWRQYKIAAISQG